MPPKTQHKTEKKTPLRNGDETTSPRTLRRTPSPMGFARVGAAEDDVRPTLTKSLTSKKSPKQSAEKHSVASDPYSELKAARAEKKAEWEQKTKKEGQPWANPKTLETIFSERMMPNPSQSTPSENPTVVILVGPAGAGKSSALTILGLGLNDHNTVRVNPDELYEWFSEKYGYFPPDIKEMPKRFPEDSDDKYTWKCKNVERENERRLEWWNANKDHFEERYGREFGPRDGPRTFEATPFCTPKTAGVLGQYGRILPTMESMIVEGATKEGRRLNVLLDTTGGMKEPFLENVASTLKETAGYNIVVALVVSKKEDCQARVDGPGGRNERQHRKLDPYTVGGIWDNFLKEQVACKWIDFSSKTGNDLSVVENTWTPTRPHGSARIVYRKTSGTNEKLVSDQELDSALGIYKIGIDDEDNTLKCHGGGVAREAGDDDGIRKRSKKGGKGVSKKRRIATRRKHGGQHRKTIKKYRPYSRRTCLRRN